MNPDLLQEEQDFSRQVRAIMNVPEFFLLRAKLVTDYSNAVSDLVRAESPEARAKIKYISEILGWFSINANKEEFIKSMIEKNTQDDY